MRMTNKQKKLIRDVIFWVCVIILLVLIAKNNGLIK